MSIEAVKKLEPLFGSWYITEQIGKGAYGEVYIIEREDALGIKSRSALKYIQISPSMGEMSSTLDMENTSGANVTYYNEIAEDIVKEIEIMSSLKGSSNIVSYEDHDCIPHADGKGWDIIIRMELLTSLHEYVKTHTMTEEDTVHLGIDICSALELCEEHDVIHRDIKPGNIMISKSGNNIRYKLGDFGIARTVERGTMGGFSRKGTYPYMAPEIYRGEQYSDSVDIYSLGIVMYQIMNNGRIPFMPPYPEQVRPVDEETALFHRLNGDEIPPPANGSKELADIILKACAYSPKDRYTNAAEMIRDLKTIFSPPSIQIRFLDEGNLVISSKMYHSGEEIVVPEIPKRDDIDGYRYVFKGWEPQLKKFAEQDTDYAAVFKPEKIPTLASDSSVSSAFFTWLKAHRILVAAVGAALILAVVLIAALTSGGADSRSPVSTSMPTPTETLSPIDISIPMPTTTPVPELEFSDWIPANALAASITSEDFVIETMTEYRSRPVYIYHKALDIPEEMIVITDELIEKDLLPGDIQIDADYNAEIVEDWHIGGAPAGVTWQDADVYRSGTYQVSVPVWVPEYSYITVNGRVAATYESGGHYEYRYESRSTVQYRDLNYYCVLADGNDWSEYFSSIKPPAEGELLDVDSRVLCRYARRLGAERAPGMENFPELIENYALRFVDVDETDTAADWQIKPIGAAAQIGAMSADAYLRFRPGENVTIGELIEAAVVIHRTYHGEEGVLWGQNYVDYALDNGLIEEGFYNDLMQKATRADAAYILCHVLPEEEFPAVNSVENISDVNKQLKVYESVSLLAQAGVISWPEPDGEFRPDDSITRAETAAFISRLAYPQMRVING